MKRSLFVVIASLLGSVVGMLFWLTIIASLSNNVSHVLVCSFLWVVCWYALYFAVEYDKRQKFAKIFGVSYKYIVRAEKKYNKTHKGFEDW